jgi:hypothetical protein
MGIDTLVVAVPVPVRPNGELVDFPDAVARGRACGGAERLPDQVLQVCLENGPDVATDWTQVRELLADGIARIDDSDLALEVELDGDAGASSSSFGSQSPGPRDRGRNDILFPAR